LIYQKYIIKGICLLAGFYKKQHSDTNYTKFKKQQHNLDELLAQVPSDYQVSEVFSDTQGIEKL
jgi:hypothetical protein